MRLNLLIFIKAYLYHCSPIFAILDCIEKCTSNERLARVAGCAYTCEMTYGYENEEFLDEIKCLVNNGCLTNYPRDGICHGDDSHGIPNLKSLDQVR